MQECNTKCSLDAQDDLGNCIQYAFSMVWNKKQ